MCNCGNKGGHTRYRSARENRAPANSVLVDYLGTQAALYRGNVTGRRYQFAPGQRAAVNDKDLLALLAVQVNGQSVFKQI